MEFSRQEYWSGLLFSSSGDLPDPGIEPGSLTLQVDYLPPGKIYSQISPLDFWFAFVHPCWFAPFGLPLCTLAFINNL